MWALIRESSISLLAIPHHINHNAQVRIVVIGPTYPFRGGIAQHTTLLVRTLRQQGHEVLFLSFKRQYPHWLFPGKSDRDPSLRPIRESAEFILDSINPFTWRQTLKRLRQWQPSLVILPWWVTFWTPVWWYLSRGMKRSEATLAFIVHNALPHEAHRWDRWLLRLALGRGDKFVAHAASEAQVIREMFGGKTVSVTPMPSFAQADGFVESAETPLPYPENKPLLLFCGLIRPYKGLDILLDALPLVLAKHDVHLAIIGEMWGDGSVYFAQIERLGLAEHLTVENEFVSDERLHAWIQAADVVTLPYRSATQSAVVQLALGLGTPVIVTRVGGLAEAIDEGVNGVFGGRNSAEFAQAINSFLNAPFHPPKPNTDCEDRWITLANTLCAAT